MYDQRRTKCARPTRGLPRQGKDRPDGVRAIVRDEYGPPDVLKMEDVDKPEPEDGEVRVRVRAASINTADFDQLTGSPRVARLFTGVTRPGNRRLGLDMAGEVETVGPGVTRLAPGDAVWADLFTSGGGAFAEYVCAAERVFHRMPRGLSFEQGATVPHSGLLALQGLETHGAVRPGQKILINGAGGCVGPFAIQIAKSRGAEVTAVDHGAKLDMVRSLGADHAVDYTRDDFTKHGRRYDRILDIAARRTLVTHLRVLTPGGVYVRVARTMGGFFRAAVLGSVLGLASGRKMGNFAWKPNHADDLERLGAMILSGDVAPLIDQRFPLGRLPEAMRYQLEGKARGKLLVTM